MEKSNPLKTRIKGTKLPDGCLVPPQGLIRKAMLDGELREKFKLLFAQYGVTEGNWKHLAVALASEHEPGFRLVAPSGRPPGNPWVWNEEKDAKLVRDVDSLLGAGMKVRPACKHLIERSSAYRGTTPEGLRSRYKTLKGRT